MANDDTRAVPLVCAHALDIDAALPDPATLAGCPVCWRRWRLAEARMHGWTPLAAATARPLLERMAAEAAAGTEPDPTLSRGFYAFLAGSPDDEADFAAACIVAFAPPSPEPQRRPRADFGWRALFAGLPASPPERVPDVSPVPTATFTRVWQWRVSAASGTTPRREMRAFVRGESPPPFGPFPAGPAARWVRERAPYDGADTTLRLHQTVGPLALSLTETGSGMASLTLRLRDGAGVGTLPVRLYGSGGAGVPLWAGTLSPAAEEATIPLDREASRAFTVEFDTAW